MAKAKPRPKTVVHLSTNYVPVQEKIWRDIDAQPFDDSCFAVSKFISRKVRHEASVSRESDGAVNFGDLIEKLKVIFVGTLQWTFSTLVNYFELGTERRKGFNTACFLIVR